MALDVEKSTTGDAETKGHPKTSLESKQTTGASNPVADTATLTPAQHRRILIKTNCVVLVLMVTTSLMAFLDKNALGFAAVYGMREDTGLKNQEYSWLGSIFYFGYLAMEFPAVWLLTKLPIGRFIGTVCVLWGITITATASCHNFAGLATARLFLGIFEAALLPSCVLLTSIWFRREEHGIVSALYMGTWAGIFGGILAYAIGQIDGGLSPWKYLYLIYGSITVLIGTVTFFALPSSPTTAWFFTEEEKKLVVLRLAGSQTGMHTQSKRWKKSQVLETLRDPKYYVMCFNLIVFSITNSAVTNFNPLIISGYGFSRSKTALMSSPQAAVALIAQVSATILMVYIPNIRCTLWFLSTLPALAGAVMIRTLDIETQRTASLAGVYMMGFYDVSFVAMLSLSSSNNSGITKKSFASVSVAVFYSIGNIIGPQFFLSEQAPYYELGISALMACFAINGLMGIVYGLICFYQNKRRDHLYGKPEQGDVDAGLEVETEDLTDGQNHNFRYTY